MTSWKQGVMSMAVLAMAASGCAEATLADDHGGYTREVRGSGLRRVAVDGVARDRVDLGRLLASSSVPVPEARGVELGAAEVTAEPGLLTAHAAQTVDGVPVRGAYLYVVVRAADGGGEGELLATSYHLYEGATLEVAPSLDRGAAIAAAKEALRATGEARAELVVAPDGGVLRLAWEITIADVDRRARVTARGEDAGAVEIIDDRVWDTRGHVTGWIASGGAPGGRGVPRPVPLAELTVHAGTRTAVTRSDGAYTVAAPDGATVSAFAVGRAAAVLDAGGAAITASAPASAEVELTLASASASDRALAQTTAYHYLTRAWQFLGASGVPLTRLGAPVTARVNQPDTCNAYFSPSARTLNYFRAGGGCRNTAEASVVVHEYGHFVDDAFGGIVDSGLSEGWGDALACLVLEAPTVGADLFDHGDPLRSCDNDYRYPRSGDDEVHALGQAWSGFVWDLRAGLIAALGHDDGEALARALVLPSLVSNAPDIPSAVREVFLRDDDDHDLRNHTPHWDILVAAAHRHGLELATDDDRVSPGRVDDLAGTATSATRVHVRWTAPGDDGDRGTAGRYELRWSPSTITEANFAAATAVPAPPPEEAGRPQGADLTVPPVGRVWVAVRAVDEHGNAGPLSHVASVELPAPDVVFGDDAEHGLGAWQASGLWHVTARRHASGTHAFWYGVESSGDYDTGATTHGTLVSPVIDLSGVAAPALAWREAVAVERDPTWDRLRIEVVDADDPSLVIAADKPAAPPRGFAMRLLDLGGLAGRRVRVRFVFDSGDATLNRLDGWFVDDVQVIRDEATPMPPTPVPPGAARLLVNEVLADPPADVDVDGNGAWSARGDEMIELVNVGSAPLALGGATVADGDAVRLTLPPGLVLGAGKVLVITGGAAPAISGVTVLGSAGLLLNNDGDTVTVRSAEGAVLATATYGPEGGHDQALTRQIDGDPTSPLVGHRQVSSLATSPGRRADGRPF